MFFGRKSPDDNPSLIFALLAELNARVTKLERANEGGDELKPVGDVLASALESYGRAITKEAAEKAERGTG
jgi:hypothetical protein